MSNGHSEEGLAATAGTDYNDGHDYHAQEIQDHEQHEREQRMSDLRKDEEHKKTPVTKRDFLNELVKDNNLTPDDIFKHKHLGYTIICLSGIEKIQYRHNIRVVFESVVVERDFAVIKATATGRYDCVQSYGGALKGKKPDGNTDSAYIVEMAEKRAKARAVLKLCGAYKFGVKSDDESEEFERPKSFSKELQGPDQ